MIIKHVMSMLKEAYDFLCVFTFIVILCSCLPSFFACGACGEQFFSEESSPGCENMFLIAAIGQ